MGSFYVLQNQKLVKKIQKAVQLNINKFSSEVVLKLTSMILIKIHYILQM